MSALVLCVFFVGLFLVAYMLISKPDGTLAVTYAVAEESETEAEAEAGPTDDGARSDLTSRLRELEDAHRAGLVTDEERSTRRAAILADL